MASEIRFSRFRSQPTHEKAIRPEPDWRARAQANTALLDSLRARE
jgi:hypothetical protein